MKRLIASRKLKRECYQCRKSFIKGDVYYKVREVYSHEWDGGCSAFEYLMCPKCKYETEDRLKRFQEFKGKCTHPDKFVHTKWRYMDGETVMEPDYDYCELCGNMLY